MRRPIVLISAGVFLLTLFVLLFPSYFPFALSGALVLIALFSLMFSAARKHILIIPTAVVLIFSVLNPYLSFIRNESKAEEFARSIAENKDTVYTAEVIECNVYSSYSQIFARLTHADGVKLKDEYKVRLGGFNRIQFDKGDTVIFTGKPQPSSTLQKEDFNTPLYLRSKKIFIAFPYANITSSSKGEAFSPLNKIKSYTKNIIYSFVPKGYDFNSADICYTMFSGEKDILSVETKSVFRQSGLTHLFSVSGLHLAIIASLIYRLLSGLTVHKNIKCVLVSGICVFYTVFTGASISTVRACIMCIVAFTGLIIGRKTDGIRSLFASLLAITLVSPYSVFDISALLSFSATLGIICLSEAAPKYTGENKLLRLLSPVCGIFFVNLGAMLFTLALSSYFFSEMSLVSAISTLTVSFPAQVLLILIATMLLISPIMHIGFLRPLISVIGSICNLLCTFILNIAEFFARFRYSTAIPVFSDIWICIFALGIILLCASMAWDKRKFNNACIIFIAAINILFSFISLYTAIINDGTYKITYYRKNEDDRQLSVKLATEGYLLINADNTLCTNDKHLPFDKSGGANYLLIIPDESITPHILSDNIKSFDEKYGIQKVFIPNNEDGKELASRLSEYNVTCFVLPSNAQVGDINIALYEKDGYLLSVSDKTTKTQLLFADSYCEAAFDKDCDICAFFTRKTKNQFSIEYDTIPNCSIFITRLGKDESIPGCINTNGEKTITVKG